MRQPLTIILIILSISLFSCNSNMEKDEIIIKEIFPQLVDSLDIKFIKFPPPPPPQMDSVTDNPESKIWEERMKAIESQKELVLFIDDTLQPIKKADLNKENLMRNRQISDLLNTIDFKLKPQKINLDKLEEIKDFNFRYYSKNVKDRLKLFDVENEKFGGLLIFSRVYLNQKQNLGILKIEYIPGYDLGQGYFVTIKKIDNQWRIIKVISDWVS